MGEVSIILYTDRQTDGQTVDVQWRITIHHWRIDQLLAGGAAPRWCLDRACELVFAMHGATYAAGINSSSRKVSCLLQSAEDVSIQNDLSTFENMPCATDTF